MLTPILSFHLKRANWLFKESEKWREEIRAELTHVRHLPGAFKP